ncbi:MAG: 50S ribosomal protein L21 [Firmicutes bacterium HGW-Firmicutes-14]|jgi:large subunit ribosomal protein L21|nr:MAG: 50S ribosomal protein L21 [Firmicutes bacterium HGW-Firmicutes-14]
MYAVIATGGKQYRVKEGDVIFVEKLNAGEGETVEVTDVLAVEKEGDFRIGSPLVDGAKVVLKVLGQGKGKKIVVFKYKAKKNYRRKTGHRQPYTRVAVEKIEA